MSNVQKFIDGLRQGGLKVTPQRRHLCTVIAQTHDHPTVEKIYQRAADQMPTLSLKTVYTTLTELADLGLIRLATLGTNTLRVDANPDPHAHLICRMCEKVIDHPLDFYPDSQAAEALDFDIEEQEVIYRGRCAHCRAVSTATT